MGDEKSTPGQRVVNVSELTAEDCGGHILAVVFPHVVGTPAEHANNATILKRLVDLAQEKEGGKRKSEKIRQKLLKQQAESKETAAAKVTAKNRAARRKSAVKKKAKKRKKR